MVPARPPAPTGQQPPAASPPGYPYRPPAATPGVPPAPGNYPPPAAQPYPPAAQAPAYPPPPPGYPAQGQAQPGYPPAPATPPAAYPAGGPYPPPPGYSQQLPPGYPPPPPGYAPAQPGYPPPPPGYAPGYGAPAAGTYAQAPEAKRRRRAVLLPYMGVHSIQGDNGTNTGVGLRLGGIGGYQLLDFMSLNGEFLLDVVHPTNVPSGFDVNAAGATFSFSPLFHFAAGPAEFVVGPKLGLNFVAIESSRQNSSSKNETTVTSSALGTNLGVFFALGDTLSIGGLLNFDLHVPTESCTKINGGSQVCTKDNLGASDKIIGTMVALLF
jgi:hypothetical protein